MVLRAAWPEISGLQIDGAAGACTQPRIGVPIIWHRRQQRIGLDVLLDTACGGGFCWSRFPCRVFFLDDAPNLVEGDSLLIALPPASIPLQPEAPPVAVAH